MGFLTLMISLEHVIHSKGNTMKGKTIDRATCDATRRVSTPFLPTAIATAMEGMSPRQRVTKRRITGYVQDQIDDIENCMMLELTDIRHRRKPSETVCPAMVAMIDELCPEASKASANNVAAPEMARWTRRVRSMDTPR